MDYLSAADLTAEQLGLLLDLAVEQKARRRRALADGASVIEPVLAGRTVALLFEKPSMRTRASFEVGVHELGGHALPMWDAEIGLGRRESVADTGAVLSRYAQAIVIRTFGQARIEELAEGASVPVVNALTDLEHPCQALADLLTVREALGSLPGRRLVYVGDGNNVAHSLLLAGALSGVHVRVVHPDGYGPDPAVLERAAALGAERGAEIDAATDPAAVEGAEAVYTDVWASMGQEDEAARRAEAFAGFQVDAAMMARAAHGAVFLHCLPAHRGEEVAAEVIDAPGSWVLEQAENRLHAQKALLTFLLGESEPR